MEELAVLGEKTGVEITTEVGGTEAFDTSTLEAATGSDETVDPEGGGVSPRLAS